MKVLEAAGANKEATNNLGKLSAMIELLTTPQAPTRGMAQLSVTR